jgi:ABC-2 type transport system ATP-binding protein
LGVGFNPELSGRDNVYLNGAVLGFSAKEVEAMYEEIVAFAELERFMDQKLKNYSSGMQVRLAFSMAVRSEADILLIDEVLAVGDADFQRKCYEYFNLLKKNRKTVVFVSHDMDAVQKYCDRAMIINDSRIVDIGQTLKIAEKYFKLFVEVSTKKKENDSQDERWGDGSLRIDRISSNVNGQTINIQQTIVATSNVEDILVGIRIRSSSGQSITGTNSQFEKVVIPNLRKGDSIQIEWKVPNIFSDGRYFIDPSVAYGVGVRVADWWDEAQEFTIRKNRPLPYPIDPEIELKMVMISKKE